MRPLLLFVFVASLYGMFQVEHTYARSEFLWVLFAVSVSAGAGLFMGLVHKVFD